MKVTILIIMLGCFFGAANAQNCDIAQSGMAVRNAANTASVSTIMAGQRANLKFTVANFGTKAGCSIPANTVTAVLSFATTATGAKPYIYDGPQTFVSGYFSWTYNSQAETLRGVNINAIPAGKGDAQILVKVKGMLPGSAHSNLLLTQGNGLPDNDGNNYSAARLTVISNPVPIKLRDFTVTADHCDALLNWSTVSESNFSHFDIEYSPDGIMFFKVAGIAGKNLATGAAYKYAYSQLNGNGFYRLKLVDKDGNFEYSNTERVQTSCKETAKVMVYPNPVSYNEKLIINISGYTGRISGELFNIEGQRVGTYELVNAANTLTVTKLSAGIYMLYVRSEGEETKTFKVVVTR